MTTTLEAVNEMLESIGEPPVTTLDTGGSSDAGQAERILGREKTRLLGRGWAVNTETDLEVTIPTVALTYSTSAGTFTYGETIIGGTSSAEGTFAYELDGVIYIRPTSGTFVAETITGSSSGASAVLDSADTVSAARVPVAPDWIKVDQGQMESRRAVPRSGYLYDLTDHTFDFSSSLRLDVMLDLDINDLTTKLAAYVVRSAAIAFQRFIKRGEYDDEIARDMLRLTQAEAYQEDDLLRDTNLLDTAEAREFRGHRRDFYSRANIG